MSPAPAYDEPLEPPSVGLKAPAERERLLEALVELCEAGGGAKTERGQEVLEGVFLDLVGRAEREMRLRLSARLASAPWAPSGLVNALALDDIEIARPVIAKSPVLKDRDLIFLLAAATLEHQIEVARRPALGEEVVKVIIDQADPIVLTALAGNTTAEMSKPSMQRLVALSQRMVAMRAPLTRHPKLNQELAATLYGWVGKALKTELMQRFEVDGAALDAAVRSAVEETVTGAPQPQASSAPENQDEMERRLIAKLHAADQLRPGFLLRALRQGKLNLFVLAIASLADVKTETVRAAINSDQPELLALLCASVQIDRSVFPTLLNFVRALNASRPLMGHLSEDRIAAAFREQDPDLALSRFRVGVAGLENT